MARGGFLLSRHVPHRTCTGCRTVSPQHDLVRVAADGPRLVVDPRRYLPGRGAYVHARTTCVTIPGLARSLRRSVSPQDVQRIVTQLGDMSLLENNSNRPRSRGGSSGGAGTVEMITHDEDRDHLGKNAPGLAGADTVETPPRIKAKDDRSEDARV
ncbi:MAG: YlxR family protein [Kofleriaceae bacterium]